VLLAAKCFVLRGCFEIGLMMANVNIVRQLQLGHTAFFSNMGTAIAKQAPDLGTAIAIL
jgi:hypothetical protein